MNMRFFLNKVFIVFGKTLYVSNYGLINNKHHFILTFAYKNV